MHPGFLKIAQIWRFSSFILPFLNWKFTVSPKTNQKKHPAGHNQVDFSRQRGPCEAAGLLSDYSTHSYLEDYSGTWRCENYQDRQKKQQGAIDNRCWEGKKNDNRFSWWNRDRDRKREKERPGVSDGYKRVRIREPLHPGSRWPFSAFRMWHSSFTAGPLCAVSKSASAFWIPFSKFSSTVAGAVIIRCTEDS